MTLIEKFHDKNFARVSSSQDRFAGKDSFDEFSFVYQHDTAYQQVLDTQAGLQNLYYWSPQINTHRCGAL